MPLVKFTPPTMQKASGSSGGSDFLDTVLGWAQELFSDLGLEDLLGGLGVSGLLEGLGLTGFLDTLGLGFLAEFLPMLAML